MEDLLDHAAAMDLLWAAVGFESPAAAPARGAERHFPVEGGWYWVRPTSVGDEPVVDPTHVAWLDGRFRVVERVYRAHAVASPRIKPAGDHREPRGVEPWEWSCIGLHGLWRGWAAPRGVVLADLRPALFDLVDDDGDSATDGHERPAPREYELSYPTDRVEALAAALVAAAPPPLRAAWRRTLADAAARHSFGSAHRPSELLAALEADGLARRAGAKIAVRGPGGGETDVAESTFRSAARAAIGRRLFDRFA